MSASFYIEYLGAGVVIGRPCRPAKSPDASTPFTSEADAVVAAHQHGLNPQWVKVLPLNGAKQE